MTRAIPTHQPIKRIRKTVTKEFLPHSIESYPNSIEIVIPIMIRSEANGLTSLHRFTTTGKPKMEHWREKAKRHSQQRKSIFIFLNPHKNLISLPCQVTMIRYAPRFLDEEDNLRIGLKWVKDAIAELLTGDSVPGRADSDKRITWKYDQVKSSNYGLKLIFSFFS